jgi:hypothetical protein
MTQDNNKISMDKKYTTRGGEPVRVLCVDSGDDEYPVIAVGEGGAVYTYTNDGFHSIIKRNCEYDLVEVADEYTFYVAVIHDTTQDKVFSYSDTDLDIFNRNLLAYNKYPIVATTAVKVKKGEFINA